MAHVAVVTRDMSSLIPGFLLNRAADLHELRRCVRTVDFASTRAIGERLYALGVPYGFDGITAIGERIRRACADADTGLIALLANELEDYLKRVQIIEIPAPIVPKWQSARPAWT
jgi:hypothetical protein